MTDQLPARLSRSELMPPEAHLRPRSGVGLRLGIFFSTIIAFSVLVAAGSSVLGIAMFLAILGGIVWVARTNVTAVRENQRGVGMLNVGEIEQAEAIFDSLARRKFSGRNHVVFVYNVGVSALLKGRYSRALSIFNAIDRSGYLRKTHYLRNLEPNLYIEMGCCHALAGDLANANAQLRRADELLEPPEDARLLFLETLIRVRRGEYEDAVTRAEEQWRRAEGTLRGPTLRTLRIICAFALEQVGKNDSRKFDLMVAGAMPAQPEDFDWATGEWPELREFVKRVVVW